MAEPVSQDCRSHGPISPMDGWLAFNREIEGTACWPSLLAISGIVIPAMAMPSIVMPPATESRDSVCLRMAVRAHRSERAGDIARRGQRGHRQQQRNDRAREYALDHHPISDPTTKVSFDKEMAPYSIAESDPLFQPRVNRYIEMCKLKNASPTELGKGRS